MGAQGIYFGSDFETEEEEESDNSSTEEEQQPSTSASGPHSLNQQRPSTSRGRGKRRASGPPSLQPSSKRVRVRTTEEEEGDEESDGSEYFLVSMKPFGAVESFVCECKA